MKSWRNLRRYIVFKRTSCIDFLSAIDLVKDSRGIILDVRLGVTASVLPERVRQWTRSSLMRGSEIEAFFAIRRYLKMIVVEGIDHLVLTVRSVEETVEFYSRVLGMEIVRTGDRVAMRFGRQKINLHPYHSEFEPKAFLPTPGSADFCLITSSLVREVLAHLMKCGVEVVEGPVFKSGALGQIESVYFRDPDRNLVEIARYANE
jgi:catechol 2,3-dioxygenase-like lactoylglutathione lyase family enzyme